MRLREYTPQLSRAFLLALILMSTSFLLGTGSLLYLQERSRAEEATRALFDASARHTAQQMAVYLKIRDIPSVNQIISQSLVASGAQGIRVLDSSRAPVMSLTERGNDQTCLNGAAETATRDIIYAGEVIGWLEYCFLMHPHHLNTASVVLLLIFVAGIVLFSAAIYLLFRWQTISVEQLLDFIGKIDREHPAASEQKLRIRDPRIRALGDKIVDLVRNAVEAIEEREKVHRMSAQVNLGKQVAHDIRSPLAALETVVTATPNLDEDERRLTRLALERIREILVDLLAPVSSTSAEPGHNSSSPTPVALRPLVLQVIEEKRLEYRHRSAIRFEYQDLANNRDPFVVVSAKELRRAISNLMNNAVEAMNQRDGIVRITLEQDDARVRLMVKDRGAGIPSSVLEQLSKRVTSHGKSGGHGLGLSHAMALANGAGGRLSIESEVDQGTRVTLVFPMATPPSWYLPRLEIKEKSRVIIVDDDSSIHAFWEHKLNGYPAGVNPPFSLVHLRTLEALRWFVHHDHASEPRLFLCDQHFKTESESGLDVIEQLSIGNAAILVTGRDEDADLQAQCARMQIRMLPKSAISAIPIQIVP